ncbi:MAG TPA: hypothetical protein PLA94_20160, partial [Myxococcota bacterium]|nr:hypothetical protein [Myxococcota bacterium]
MIFLFLSCGRMEPAPSAAPEQQGLFSEKEEDARGGEGGAMGGAAPSAPPPPAAKAAPGRMREEARDDAVSFSKVKMDKDEAAEN